MTSLTSIMVTVGRFSVVAALLFSVACAGPQPRVETYDPLENVNRPLHTFNTKFDRIVMQPIVDAYVELLHEDWRLSVSNFFDNLTYPNVIVNTFLQGKVKQGFSDVGRFVMNSTLGVAGLFDAATVFGLEEHDEDLGQTLAVWGLSEGPYLTLPFFGPSTARDLPDLGGSILTNIFTYVGTPVLVAGVTATAPLALLGIIDKRARADKAIRARDQLALDSYVFTREAYRQHRAYLIYDGNPPLEFYAKTDTLDEALLELEEELADESTDHPSDPSASESADPANPVSVPVSVPDDAPLPTNGLNGHHESAFPAVIEAPFETISTQSPSSFYPLP